MKKIFIFGLGAIGSNLLLQLIKKYPENEYIGIDYDIVEERNINTQSYLLPHVGMKKVNAIQIVLGLNMRKFNYIPIDIKIIENVLNLFEISGEDILIDCFDNTKSRKILHNTNSNNILHIGFSLQYSAEMIWNENYSVPNDIPEEQNDICEMNEAIPFINFTVSRACGVISNFIEKNIKEDYIITNKYNIKKLN